MVRSRGVFTKYGFYVCLPPYKIKVFFCIFRHRCKTFYSLCPIFNRFYVHFVRNRSGISPHPAHRCPHNILWFLFTAFFIAKFSPSAEKHSRSASFRSLHTHSIFPRPVFGLPYRGKTLEKSAFFALLYFSYTQNRAIIELNQSVCTYLRIEGACAHDFIVRMRLCRF